MAENKNTSNEIEDAAKRTPKARVLGKIAGKAAKGVAKKAAKNPIIIKGILVSVAIMIGLSFIIQGSSSLQLEDTYGLSPSIGMFRKQKINEDAMKDRSVSQKRTQSMMETVQKVVSDNHEDVRGEIEDYCIKNGYDVDMSMSSIVDFGSNIGDTNFSPPPDSEKDNSEEKPNKKNEEEAKKDKDKNVKNKSNKNNENNKDSRKKESSKDKNRTKNDKKGDKDKDKEDEKDENTGDGQILQKYDLSMLTEANRNTMTYENYFRRPDEPRLGWAANTFQGKFAQAGKGEADAYGLIRSKDDYQDFLIALGSYFGPEGNRYRITFGNGKAYTFLKFDEKADRDTVNGICHGRDGSVIEFLVDQNGHQNKLHPAMAQGNIQRHPLGLFDQGLVSIELIDGKVDVSDIAVATSMAPKILAAFSVSQSNIYHKKDEKNGKYYDNKNNELLPSIVEELYGEAGAMASDYWMSTLMPSELNEASNTLLKKKLKKYIRRGNSFFTVEYQESTTTITETEKIEIPPKKPGDKPTYEEVITEKEVKYCIPTIKAKDVNQYSEEIFDINPSEEYINADNITNSEAIEKIAEQTYALLYDTKPGASGGSYGPEGDGKYSGKFGYPVEKGKYVISQNFGNANGNTYHYGVDLATGVDGVVDVMAADGGIVEIAGSGAHPSYGQSVLIKHDEHTQTRYAHMTAGSIRVKKGQKVSKGQVLGKVGNTGISTGPHLHFEVIVDGRVTNPGRYLPDLWDKNKPGRW